MLYEFLATVVVVIHFVFVVFVAVGGFIAWRHPAVLAAHVPAVGWALGIVTIGQSCPLTGLEHTLRQRAGSQPDDGGFVDRYLTGVLYPTEYEELMQALVAVVVVTAYVGLALRSSSVNDACRRRWPPGRTRSWPTPSSPWRSLR